MDNLKKMSETAKVALQLDFEPISVRFSDALPEDVSEKFLENFFRDTACTALCRCLKKKEKIVIAPHGNQYGVPSQPCAGANFFFNWGEVTQAEACDVYVKTEQVFASSGICLEFLKQIPSSYGLIEKKLIILSPFDQESVTPQIVVFVVNATQASRILGASVYHCYQEAKVMPAIPTCLSLYLPLTDQKVYVNFIDYYDRYHQGKQGKEQFIWGKNEMIISMTFSLFQEIVNNINLTPHGKFKPVLEPQIFDQIV